MTKQDEALPVYKDPSRSLDERVDDLIARLTLEEKISQMLYFSSALPRVGIPEYNWWNECLHGVARAGVATVFPQAIGLAASFNQELLYQVASVIADEARAKHHEFAKKEDRGIYKGLTFWSPNINIFRDPRWGRGQETYGEDPYLTGRLGVAFIRGLQGDHPKYLKVAACAKHFAVHSGPETLRHEFNAVVGAKDLRETYLPAFRDAVMEAKVEAVNNGCDLNCGRVFASLQKAVAQGLVSEKTIDQALRRLFKTRFKLGMFDPPELVPYANIPYEVNASPEHRRLALQAARESIVLLKNEDNLLPLDPGKIKRIAVIGPNADNKDILLGNYYGVPAQYVTPLAGIRARVGPDVQVLYAPGCDLATRTPDSWGEAPTSGFAEALAAAERAEVAILCLGLSPKLEGEEGAVANSDGGGDRTSLDLPGMQEELLKAVAALNKPVVLVLFNESPVAINWAQEKIPAIIEAWYPGEEGGTALAEVIFGDYNPGGRLPVTFVKSLDQLPPFTDYRMMGRTYRYMQDEPLYPFGYGLSYTTFAYRQLAIDKTSFVIGQDQSVRVTVEVENTGPVAGDEVVQLYLKHLDATVVTPNFELQGFKRLSLAPGAKQTVEFVLQPRQLAVVDETGTFRLEPGTVRIYVGGRQPDARSRALAGTEVLEATIVLSGPVQTLAP
nr:glycoside hydrolase family 3 C-terminal domain-containing protein [Capillibacterium thermochitinicola]